MIGKTRIRKREKNMFGVGTGEFIIIIIIAILVFGPKRLPEVAKTAGRFMADVRKATSDLKRDFEEEIGIDDLSDLHPRRMAKKMLTGDDLIDSIPDKSHDYVARDYDDNIYPDVGEEEESEETKKNAAINNKENEDSKNGK
jgi:sec-independent protein translocase protein TatB